MDHICRTCLKEEGNIFNIYTHSKNDKLISNMLMEHTIIKFSKDDKLPRSICNDCLDKLIVVSDFREMVVRSNAKLLLHDVDTSKAVQVKNEGFHSADIVGNMLIKEEVTVLNIESTETHKPNEISKNTKIDNPVEANVMLLQNNAGVNIIKTNVVHNNSKANETMIFEDDSHHNVELSDDSNHNITDDVNFENLPAELIQKSNISNIVQGHNEVNNSREGQKKSRIKRYFCKECNKFYGRRYYFGIHIRQHSGDKPYNCEICGKVFAKEYILNNHKRLHSDDKPFTCSVCDKSFKTQSSRINHMRIHIDIRPFKCDICNKAFKDKAGINIHKRSHSNVSFCICEICGKSYRASSGLYYHMQTHRSEKQFPCSECGKLFKHERTMKRHCQTVHMNIRDFACAHCDKRFTCSGVLKTHMLIHTGAKPHTCKICGKTFRHLSCIRGHMRTHTGETPYRCSFCPSSFKFAHLLRKHIKYHK